MSVKYVYTLSDVSDLVQLTIKSIRSLRKFAKKEDVIVFFTPPVNELAVSVLRGLAIVRVVENVSEPFFVRDHPSGNRAYGEKLHLCSVDATDVVFLDCDTVIKQSLEPLLKLDYDFLARKDYDLKPGHNVVGGGFGVPNTGFMIFRNGLHKRIGGVWRKYLVNLIAEFDCDEPVDELSLAYAVKDCCVKWVGSEVCAYSWCFDSEKGVFVVHGRKQKFVDWFRFVIGHLLGGVNNIINFIFFSP